MRPPLPGYRALALEIAQSRGIARARDFKAAGVPLTYLKRLTEAGDLVRLGRGLYQMPERLGESAAHDLAEVARRAPHGVISLMSALRHHDLTTELPRAIWLTIPHRARTPAMEGIRLEIVRATGAVLSAGVEHVDIEGVDVPIYGVAKTIADCFKHRRRVGEDLAVEALREALHRGKTTPDELRAYAAIDRVEPRLLPHLGTSA